MGGNYIDKKCPFVGKVSIRGRILTGVITKMKMNRTVVIRRDYLLREEVQQVREAPQEHVCPPVPLLQGRPGRRRRHRRRVQTSQQEVVRQVLTDVPTTMLKR